MSNYFAIKKLRKTINKDNRINSNLNNTFSNLIKSTRNKNYNTKHVFNQEVIKNRKIKLEEELNKKNEIIKSLKKEIEKLKTENSLLKVENEQLRKIKNRNLTKKESKIILARNIPIRTLSNEEEKLEFPKGEHYYNLIKDININPKNNNNIKEKIQIYFSFE